MPYVLEKSYYTKDKRLYIRYLRHLKVTRSYNLIVVDGWLRQANAFLAVADDEPLTNAHSVIGTRTFSALPFHIFLNPLRFALLRVFILMFAELLKSIPYNPTVA